MTRVKLLPIAILSLMYFLLGGCGGGDDNDNELHYASETFSLEIPRGEKTTLSIHAVNGSIILTENPGISSILVSGEKKIGSYSSLEDAQQHLDELSVENTEQGNILTLKTIQPQKSEGRNYIVDYEISFSNEMLINVSQINGEIHIQSTSSNFSLSQINGSIEAESTIPSQGSFNLSTANGDITLTIPSDTSSLLSSLTATGEIIVSNLTINDQVRTSQSLSGTLGEGEGNIKITSANGNITIKGQ